MSILVHATAGVPMAYPLCYLPADEMGMTIAELQHEGKQMFDLTLLHGQTKSRILLILVFRKTM